MPLFQNEGRCSVFDMEVISHSHANKTHFHMKGCALSLILKVRVLELGSGLLCSFYFQLRLPMFPIIKGRITLSLVVWVDLNFV